MWLTEGVECTVLNEVATFYNVPYHQALFCHTSWANLCKLVLGQNQVSDQRPVLKLLASINRTNGINRWKVGKLED